MWSKAEKKAPRPGAESKGAGTLAQESVHRLSFPPELVLPLAQQLGVPAVPLVREGQEVVRGEPIARAGGFFSLPLHAPATGVIRQIADAPGMMGEPAPAIFLKLYPSATQEVLYGAEAGLTSLALNAIQASGVVDTCGVALPVHVKMTLPGGKPCEVLLISACESVRGGAANYRLLQEHPAEIVKGLLAVSAMLSPRQVLLALDANLPQETEALRKALPHDFPLTILPAAVPHSRMMERQLLHALGACEVPEGYLPAEVGAVVLDIATMAQLGALLPWQRGMIERLVSVVGPGVSRPGNYLAPLGTPLSFLLDHAGWQQGAEVTPGSPAVGKVVDVAAPLTKAISALFVAPHSGRSNGRKH